MNKKHMLLFLVFISVFNNFLYSDDSLAKSAAVVGIARVQDEKQTVGQLLHQDTKEHADQIPDADDEKDQEKKEPMPALRQLIVPQIPQLIIDGGMVGKAAATGGLTFGFGALLARKETLKHIAQQNEYVELEFREMMYARPRVFEFVAIGKTISAQMLKEANLFETATDLEKHNKKFLAYRKAMKKTFAANGALDTRETQVKLEFLPGLLYGIPKAALKGGVVCAGDIVLSQKVSDNKYARIVYRQSLTALVNIQGNNTQERMQYVRGTLPKAVLKGCVVEGVSTAITDYVVDEVEKRVDPYLPKVTYNPEGDNTQYYLVTGGKVVVKETTRCVLKYLLATKVVTPLYDRAGSTVNPGPPQIGLSVTFGD